MTLCDFVSESAMDNPKYVDDFDQKKIVRYVHKNVSRLFYFDSTYVSSPKASKLAQSMNYVHSFTACQLALARTTK